MAGSRPVTHASTEASTLGVSVAARCTGNAVTPRHTPTEERGAETAHLPGKVMASTGPVMLLRRKRSPDSPLGPRAQACWPSRTAKIALAVRIEPTRGHPVRSLQVRWACRRGGAAVDSED